MSGKKVIEFWFDFASTYSYLSAMRIEPLATDAGFEVRWKPFPQNSLYAARLALAAQGEPWHGELCRGIFIAEFADGQNLAAPEVLAGIIEKLGAEPAQWAERMSAPGIKQALKDQVSEASRRGVFGAPSFFVGDELFWGDDRLNQALGWRA